MRQRTGVALRLIMAGLMVLVAGCASLPKPSSGASGPVKQKIGRPYQISGIWYYPRTETNYDQVGIASWYGEKFHGAPTANGEIFDMNEFSAAHTTLPLPSWVEVTNLENGKSMVVRVNDRGPFVDGRLIDLSKASAEELGYLTKGVARVRVRLVDPPAGGLVRSAQQTSAEPELVQIASLEPVALPVEKPASAPLAEIADPVQQPASKPGPGNPQVASIPSSVPPPPRKPSVPEPSASELSPVPAPASKPVVPASTASVTNPSPVTPDARYVVQVATFSSPDNAQRLAESFDATFSAFLNTYTLDDGRILNQVRLGPFNSRQDAEEALKAAQAKGLNDARIFRQKG